MVTKKSAKAKANGNLQAGIKVEFCQVRQRQIEEWTRAFQEEGGHEITAGVHLLTGATVRALVKAGILVQPEWTLEDVDNALPHEVMAVSRAFDKLYQELTTVPKN